MSSSSRIPGPFAAQEPGDALSRPALPQRRAPFAAAAMKRRWRVSLGDTEEQVEADEIDLMPSGVLAFYRVASRMEMERTLLVAWAPQVWRSCRLESSD